MDHTDTDREEPAIWQSSRQPSSRATHARTVTTREAPMWCASRRSSMRCLSRVKVASKIRC